MRVRAKRSATVLATVLGLSVLSGCGGSGGGGGGGGTATIPGTLTTLTLEGASAPGTGGSFGSFGPATKVAVGDGGWVAFVADVIGGSAARGLFVVRPDGTIVDVYLKGQNVPAPGTGSAPSGTIDDFQRIWITGGGVVVAKITATGGTATTGIVSARVPTNAVATEKAGVVYNGAALPASQHSAPGSLAVLYDDLIQVDEQGDVFFVGEVTASVSGVFTYNRAGTTGLAAVVSGDDGPTGGIIGADFDGLGIDADGQVVAFVVSSAGERSLIAKKGVAGSGVLVAKNGTTHASIGGRSFENVYDSGPIYVTYGAGTSFVTWQVDLNGSSPDKAVFTRQVVGGDILTTGALLAMAVPNQGVSGVGAGAFMTNIRLIDGQIDPNRIPILVDVALGTTSRVLFSCPDAATLTGVTYEGQVVPDPAETTFTANYPSLLAFDSKCGDYTGTLAFSAVLANGSSGVFWAIHNYGFFQIARQGGAVPGLAGVTFAPFIGNGAVIPASGCVVFQANLAGGTSPTGLFRQR